jgi:hypothetical protein
VGLLSGSLFVHAQTTATTLIRIILVGMTILWVRLMAAVAVRQSIDRSIQMLQNTISHPNDAKRTILIGFSWGGTVSRKSHMCRQTKTYIETNLSHSSGTGRDAGERNDWKSRSTFRASDCTNQLIGGMCRISKGRSFTD